MFNKYYEKILKILKEEYKSLLFLCLFTIIMIIPVPYYITTGGGITDLSLRFEIEGEYPNKGSYNLSYVSQIDGRVLTYLLSFVLPSWEKEKISDYKINDNETPTDIEVRDKLSLLRANQNAVMVAYKNANKEIKINKNNLYVIYVDKNIESDKNIMIGDIITKIDNISINSFNDIKNHILNVEEGKEVSLEIKRDDKIINANVKVRIDNNDKIIGLSFYDIYDYEVTPNITFKFKNGEQGSSAGFMTSLAIYDSLIEEDLTSGYKIAGTGTIDENGQIGQISGIKYKLSGAERSGASIFFAPSGDNYEEAVKIKQENKYDIEVVEVSSFIDAVNYLRKIKK